MCDFLVFSFQFFDTLQEYENMSRMHQMHTITLHNKLATTASLFIELKPVAATGIRSLERLCICTGDEDIKL
jgi:hypothetical protein